MAVFPENCNLQKTDRTIQNTIHADITAPTKDIGISNMNMTIANKPDILTTATRPCFLRGLLNACSIIYNSPPSLLWVSISNKSSKMAVAPTISAPEISSGKDKIIGRMMEFGYFLAKSCFNVPMLIRLVYSKPIRILLVDAIIY